MKKAEFSQAIPFLVRAINEDPLHYGNWYMAGQCFRFIGDYQHAIRYLKKAAELGRDEKSVFLALGIALQLSEQFDEAIDAFRRALEIDPNYDLAFNSLALTQMKNGDYGLALHNYDVAIKSMACHIAESLDNSRSRGIIKHHDSPHMLWAEFAMFGALYLTSLERNIRRVAWPTGDYAIQEERDEGYDGLYWIDRTDNEGEIVRLFLPNYFNTFREHLTFDTTYSTYLRGKGSALLELGRRAEADKHFEEAAYFLPKR